MPEKIWSYCEGIPDKIEVPLTSVVEMFWKTAEKFPNRDLTEFKGKYKKY